MPALNSDIKDAKRNNHENKALESNNRGSENKNENKNNDVIK